MLPDAAPSLTPDRLARAAGIPLDVAAAWAPPLSAAMAAYAIAGPRRQAAFIAQLAHESAGFTRLEENLNYSASRLMQVWPTRFPTADKALLYAHNPEKLANHVYANRMGNGDEASGDGWRFRGRGPIQLTGRTNYAEASADLFGSVGMPDRLVEIPDSVLDPWVGAAVAARFWYVRKLNDLADIEDWEQITRRINGGLHGLEDRLARTETAIEAFA